LHHWFHGGDSSYGTLGIVSLDEMKTQRSIIMGLAAVLLFAGGVWLLGPSRGTGQSVTLTLLTNYSVPPVSQRTFCVSNIGPRAILLTDLIVEDRARSGWRALSHTVSTHPQRLAIGDTKDLVVGVPNVAAPWRLRVTYGTDVKGPVLLLAKAEYAITHLRLTGPGFGVMAGSNSCVSVEMSK
jgi:hypothetical protein